MKRKIEDSVKRGLCPVHLLSIESKNSGSVLITKTRHSKKYNTTHLQIDKLHKSPI